MKSYNFQIVKNYSAERKFIVINELKRSIFDIFKVKK